MTIKAVSSINKMEKIITSYRVENPTETIEFQLVSNQLESEVEKRLVESTERIVHLDTEIDRLTDNSDSMDIWVSVGAGVLCGLIDMIYVGEISLDLENGTDEETRAQAHKLVNEFIGRVANDNGYNGERLNGAISHIEGIAPVDNDNYRSLNISSSRLHHLEDVAHHPTPLGLAAALCVSFFRVAVFTDKSGKTHFKSLPTNASELFRTWLPVLISGVIYWLACIGSRKYSNKELSEHPKWVRVLIKSISSAPILIQLSKIAHNWALHLVSDMGGSKNTAGGGAGIPGLFISLLKEMSMFPPFNNSGLSKVVSDMYSKNKMDLRAELIPLLSSLKKQAIPVILNEIIVSSYYFVSRTIKQYKREHSWHGIEWLNVIPYGNRTIVRMRTISSGVFTGIDMADAAIHSCMKGGTADPATFICQMALRVNIVGLDRFAIAFGNDVAMGFRKSKMRKIRNQAMIEHLYLQHAKIYIQQGKVWFAAENAKVAINCLTETSDSSLKKVVENWTIIENDCYNVGTNLIKICKQDVKFNNELNQIL